jgi:hypothetical protein
MVTGTPSSSDGDRHALVQQRRDDGAGGPAGPQHQSRPGLRVYPVRAQIRDEAETIGIAAHDAAVPKHERVDRPDAAGEVRDLVAQGEGGLLVRHRDIGAGEAGRAQAAHRILERLRPHAQRHVGAIDLIFMQPESMQARGPRMGCRPADDSRENGVST